MNEAEVAIVGGGPAGAALAIRLARAGRQVVLFERLAEPRWRASGVYSSPLSRRHLEALGLGTTQLDALIQPISAMNVRTADGRRTCRLAYPAPHHACGLDRVRLEQALLERARSSGAVVHEGWTVRQVELGVDGPAWLTASGPAGPEAWRSTVVVGADGPASLVARAAEVARPARRFRRAALTVHRRDPGLAASGPAEAEMIIGRGWYCGVAPVPGQRVNLGLVLAESRLRRELTTGNNPPAILDRLLTEVAGEDRAWRSTESTDELQVCLPLAHRVTRTAGNNFVLIGDAAGFVDPLSGEGLQRAFASASLAAVAIGARLAGDRAALDRYDRRLRARYRAKDVLSWLLQLFLFQPTLAGRALANLERDARLRRTFALALADIVPATRVLDPRFLAGVLAPRV